MSDHFLRRIWTRAAQILLEGQLQLICGPMACVRAQVASVMGEGVLTSEKAEHLKEMQTKMGVTQDVADKIIKGAQNRKLISGLQVCCASFHPPWLAHVTCLAAGR